MKQYIIFALYLFLTNEVFGQSFEIEVTPDLKKNIYYFKYSLLQTSNDYNVNVKIGLKVYDGNIDYQIMKSVEGDINEVKSNGYKTIQWNFAKDYPNLPHEDSIKFYISIVKKRKFPIIHYFSITGNSLTPYGIKYGILGKNGVYFSAKTLDFEFIQSKGNSFDINTIRENMDAPYQYVKAQRQIYHFSTGYSIRFTPHFWGNIGIGLALDRTLWKVNELDSNLKTTKAYWVEYKAYEVSKRAKLILESGVNIVTKRLIFDIGGGYSFNNNIPFFSLGLGYNFALKYNSD